METPLDAIMAGRDAPAPSDQQTTPEPISDAERAANPLGAARRERDEQGRFAKGAQEQPKPDAQVKPEDQQQPEANAGGADQQDAQRRPGTVPQQALEAERKKRQDRDDQIAELLRQNADLNRQILARQAAPQPSTPQQPAPAPELWNDPDAWAEHRVKSALDPVQEQMQSMRLHFSQQIAVTTHGAEAVQGAIQALAELRQTNPQEYQRLEMLADKSMDPVGDVVRWHKQQSALREIGDDPAKYRESLKEQLRKELLAEMEAQAPVHDPHQPAATQRPVLPTSFAAQRSGAPRGGGNGYAGPRPLSEIVPRG